MTVTEQLITIRDHYISPASVSFESALKTTREAVTWLLDDLQSAEDDGDLDSVRALKRRAETIIAQWAHLFK